MSNALILLLFLTALLYTLLILSFALALARITQSRRILPVPAPFVSVIVAMRNESQHISALIMHLKQQAYPSDCYEVILSDDFSEDDTVMLAQKYMAANMKIIVSAEGDLPGKKGAQARALSQARGEILLFTDADCTMGHQWIKTMVQAMDTQTAMVAGPVILKAQPGVLFQKLQTLEFLSLQGSTAGAMALGKPIMCNGANLAVCRDEWEKAKLKIEGQQRSSGDDIFLMHALQKFSAKKIRFVWERDAVVSTCASPDWRAFFGQRSRWAAKSTSYTNGFTLITGAIVALFNLSLLVAAMAAPWITHGGQILAIVFAIKCMADLPLMLQSATFFQLRKIMWGYVPLQLIYPAYVSLTLLLAFARAGRWKNRKIY